MNDPLGYDLYRMITDLVLYGNTYVRRPMPCSDDNGPLRVAMHDD